MSIQALDYSDYHRTIIGFHGTTSDAADRLVAGEPFRASDSDDDWFGRGVYFWEYAPKQAWWWAKTFKKLQQSAVVGAIIRLGNCFDLLDPANVRVLKRFQESMMQNLAEAGIEIPRNGRQHRNLDCAVFNYLYNELEKARTPIDSARAVFVPTDSRKRVWKGSWIYEDAHIQICIRETKNILAVWHVRPDGRYGK